VLLFQEMNEFNSVLAWRNDLRNRDQKGPYRGVHGSRKWAGVGFLLPSEEAAMTGRASCLCGSELPMLQ
jgi:hypothetical protein